MDLISDALTRIRNAVNVRQDTVELRKNKMVSGIARILKEEGFIKDYTEDDGTVTVTLLYEDDAPVMTNLERVSRGGQRKYISATEIRPVLGGRGIGIVSTSRGIMTLEKAAAEKVGGEYICNIW